MNQMGPGVPNLVGVEKGNLDKKVNAFLSGYMTMGDTGMAGMGEMTMKVPLACRENTAMSIWEVCLLS